MAKKPGGRPPSKSVESVATKSAESATLSTRTQSKKSAALQNTPQNKQSSKSDGSASSTPQSTEGKGVLYDMQGRLGDPAMTSTPVAEEPGGSKRHQRDKASSRGQTQDPQLPMSPLSSVSPTNGRGNPPAHSPSPLPDPGQPTGKLATSGEEATDSGEAVRGNAAAHPCTSSEQVVGTNKGTETPVDDGDGKDVGISSTNDRADSEREQGFTSLVGVASSGCAVQDSRTKEERADVRESAPATLEVSSPSVEEPLEGSPPGTVEVSPTMPAVSEQLESVSMKPDPVPPSKEPTKTAKPPEEEVVVGDRSQVVSPMSLGEGNSEDKEEGVLREPSAPHPQQEGASSGEPPREGDPLEVGSGQEQEGGVEQLKKVVQELLDAQVVCMLQILYCQAKLHTYCTGFYCTCTTFWLYLSIV